MAGWLVLIVVVIAFLIYISYDDFDPPDDGDAVHSEAFSSSPDACPADSPMCCGGGCHV